MSTVADNDIDVSNVDIIFLLDRSGSMDTKDVRGLSRWKAGEETVSGLAEEVAEFDDDGITVVFFNSTHTLIDNVTPDKVAQIFKQYGPEGGTNLAPPLREVIDRFLPVQYETVETQETVSQEQGGFMNSLRSLFGGSPTTTTSTRTRSSKQVKRNSPKKPVCIIVATDGAANDKDAVIDVIKDATHRINTRRDLGILLVQIGSDPDAKDFLNQINNGLQGNGADHDIVAVCNLDDIENLTVKQILTKAYTE